MNKIKVTHFIEPAQAAYWMHNVPWWLIYAREGEKAAKIFDRNYMFGGWKPIVNERTTLDKETGVYKYPGDPAQRPLFKIEFNGEVIFGYRSEMWAIVQPDGSFEIARMD